MIQILSSRNGIVISVSNQQKGSSTTLMITKPFFIVVVTESLHSSLGHLWSDKWWKRGLAGGVGRRTAVTVAGPTRSIGGLRPVNPFAGGGCQGRDLVERRRSNCFSSWRRARPTAWEKEPDRAGCLV